MREIKFRAWDNESKWIIEHENINYSILKNREEHRFELLQFTGLKDKNDKEIYEGDIVRVKHPMAYKGGDFYNSVGGVFWMDGAWYHGNDCGRPPKRMFEWCEVIGNIYENPELLNDNKNVQDEVEE